MSTAATDPSYPPLELCLIGGHVSPPPPVSSLPLDVPLIDLGNLDHHRLTDACRSPGLFRLANHGLPVELSLGVRSKVRRILELPFERKRLDLAKPGAGRPAVYFWGTPAVGLNLRSINWLEGLHVSLPAIRSVYSQVVGSGWASLRPLMEVYGNHMVRIVRTLFSSVAVDLNLDPELLDSYMDASDGIFRLYRYPRLPESRSFMGMGSHTDSSVLTVVDEDDVGGLQIYHDSSWFHVKPEPNTLLIIVGDMLQAISNDVYTSVEHRVVANETKERMSLCFFVFPKEDFNIKSSNYKDFTYSDFRSQVQDDIKKIGDKVGLKRFKL